MRNAPSPPHRAYRSLLELAVFVAALPSCVHARPLTAKEREIPIVPSDRESTARLTKECRPVGTIERIGPEDDARRRAGEHRAQVVQDLQPYRDVTIGDHTERVHAYVPSRDFDARYWQCPASRAIPKPGEVIWRTPPQKRVLGAPLSPTYRELEIVRDGQVVTSGKRGFTGLSRVVSGHPPAVDEARRAEQLGRRAVVHSHVAGGFAVAILAATGAAATGYFTEQPAVLWSGVGGIVVFPFFAGGFAASSVNKGGKSATAAMTAADRYNDVRYPLE